MPREDSPCAFAVIGSGHWAPSPSHKCCKELTTFITHNWIMKFKREKKKKHRETEKQNHWAELKWFSHWTNVSIGLDIDWSILICVTNGGFITFSFLKKKNNNSVPNTKFTIKHPLANGSHIIYRCRLTIQIAAPPLPPPPSPSPLLRH